MAPSAGPAVQPEDLEALRSSVHRLLSIVEPLDDTALGERGLRLFEEHGLRLGPQPGEGRRALGQRETPELDSGQIDPGNSHRVTPSMRTCSNFTTMCHAVARPG